MAGEFYITKTCRRCDGSGICQPHTGGNPDGSCDRCGGSGTLQLDFLDLADITTKLDTITTLCNQILEDLPGGGH